jgi:hypothetical protein
MRLLIDMNLTPRWVRFLVSAGHECSHWANLGPGDAPDPSLSTRIPASCFVVSLRSRWFRSLEVNIRESFLDMLLALRSLAVKP